ncbi:MAG: ABC-ATPase domain-containing protein [Lachnospiraceae bacterium]|jgi:predicted ABC-class ATPase|nr:ABC-ATPase domain-containing protein [Lachnospiraceae bacterium]
MKTSNDLRELLTRIDHKGYPAYKDTRGSYQFEGYVLSIDHVQGDPFAAPSKVSIHVPGKTAGFPSDLYEEKHKRIALQDYLLRKFARESETFNFKAKGSGKSGLMSVSRCGQEILERTACELKQDGTLIIRMEIGFPANGRTINSRELIKILFEFLPGCVKKSLYYSSLNKKDVQKNAELAEDQQFIREQLPKLGLAAFVANGSILPRESGISNRPMKQAIAFQSPKSMELSLELPNYGKITGMGIRQGITLIVGGGYHGKSTLLKALELGVYNHISGDGREYVITNHTAVKIRAEDGRSIKQSDISMFINNLPNGKDTVHFCTQDASGSTSQAANVIEAMEAGTSLMLIDEDTSATNFMIRDELMQRVVNRDSEPITPFIDRVQELFTQYHISTILVAGSSGSYFHKADCILQMDHYLPKDITEFAKQEAAAFPIPNDPVKPCTAPSFHRIVKSDFNFKKNDRIKLKTQGRDSVLINKETIDLRYVEQLADSEQLSALGILVKYAQLHIFDGKKTLSEAVEELCRMLEKKGLPAVCEGSYVPCGYAVPRKQEIFACLNRYRSLVI